MTINIYYKGLQLTFAFLFITACNNDNPTAGEATVDSTSNANAATVNRSSTNDKPAYDTARGVTAISPNLYKELADTLNIKMLQGVYRPGDSSIMHAHPDFALYVLEGSTVELTATDGSRQNVEFKKDMAVILPATSHSAKNIGKNTLRLIVVEVNRSRD